MTDYDALWAAEEGDTVSVGVGSGERARTRSFEVRETEEPGEERFEVDRWLYGDGEWFELRTTVAGRRKVYAFEHRDSCGGTACHRHSDRLVTISTEEP